MKSQLTLARVLDLESCNFYLSMDITEMHTGGLALKINMYTADVFETTLDDGERWRVLV